MTATADDDFHQFLDMSGMGNLGDGMQFDFQGFQDGTASSLVTHGQDAPDTIMAESDNAALMSGGNALLQNQTSPMTTSMGQPSIPAHMMATSGDSISNIDAQIQYLQQQKFQQQQRQLQEQQAAFFSNHNHSVPPTPQSLEMPGSGHFYSQAEQVSQQQGVFDRGYHQRMKEQNDVWKNEALNPRAASANNDSQMAFTPLVSPAVTPLDPHFMENSFTVPNTYFSPLTSPALHAQPDSMSYDQCQSTNSPIDMDLGTGIAPLTTTPNSTKKTRKKSVTSIGKKNNVRNSPIVKSQRQKKTKPSPAMMSMSRGFNEADEMSGKALDATFLPQPATSTETSEDNNSSVSPENLSEMPPPPVPTRRSTSKSPYIQALKSSLPAPKSASVDIRPAPATPASLMKLPDSESTKTVHDHQDHSATDQIESLELPESVSNRPLAPAPLSISTQSPRIEAASKSAGFQALPSPVFTRTPGTASASQSPQLRPGSTGPSARKTPQLSSRNSRKRSTGSVHNSPALLPRISPNIKPLLPGTPGMNPAEDASRLLMTKSNYQNILEGNTVPGVSYPSELSTNLTSKRTSHKIAEQGRRNRINSALQVMASMLPGDEKEKLEEENEKKDGKQANAQNSKASVVENAIVHMKNLQQENGDLKQQLEELKKQLEQLKGPEKESEAASS